jgi:hypothetical protein
VCGAQRVHIFVSLCYSTALMCKWLVAVTDLRRYSADCYGVRCVYLFSPCVARRSVDVWTWDRRALGAPPLFHCPALLNDFNGSALVRDARAEANKQGALRITPVSPSRCLLSVRGLSSCFFIKKMIVRTGIPNSRGTSQPAKISDQKQARKKGISV